jgi:hypothetical protein
MSEKQQSASFLVDDEFASRMPKTTSFCDEGLEILIKKFGPDPLIVWKEKNVLLDGHRRKAICDRLGITYEVRLVSCANKDEALKVMDGWQLFRRNLSDHDQALLIKRMKDALVESGMSAKEAVGVVSDLTGITPRSIYRTSYYSALFSKLSEEWQHEVTARSLKKDVVKQVVKCSEKQQKLLLALLKDKGSLWLEHWCKSRSQRDRVAVANRSASRLKAIGKGEAGIDPGPSREEPSVENEYVVPPEIMSRRKGKQRLDLLLTDAEKAVGASARATYRLFSDIGINDPGHHIKRVMDKAHATLVESLSELREKYVK